jgi:hypothetical protein
VSADADEAKKSIEANPGTLSESTWKHIGNFLEKSYEKQKDELGKVSNSNNNCFVNFNSYKEL